MSLPEGWEGARLDQVRAEAEAAAKRTLAQPTTLEAAQAARMVAEAKAVRAGRPYAIEGRPNHEGYQASLDAAGARNLVKRMEFDAARRAEYGTGYEDRMVTAQIAVDRFMARLRRDRPEMFDVDGTAPRSTATAEPMLGY